MKKPRIFASRLSIFCKKPDFASPPNKKHPGTFRLGKIPGCQTVKEVPEVSEGRSPPIVNPKPAACIAAQSRPSIGFGLRLCGALCAVLEPRFASLTLPVVSEPLRSKGFLSPFAARGAVGSQANGAKVVKKAAAGVFFDELTAAPLNKAQLFLFFHGFIRRQTAVCPMPKPTGHSQKTPCIFAYSCNRLYQTKRTLLLHIVFLLCQLPNFVAFRGMAKYNFLRT